MEKKKLKNHKIKFCSIKFLAIGTLFLAGCNNSLENIFKLYKTL